MNLSLFIHPSPPVRRQDAAIVIVGAGIAGLATALALHHQGFRNVLLTEKSESVRAEGLGINLLPHAVRVLSQLGIDVSDYGVQTRELRYYSIRGQLLDSELRGIAAGYMWPQVSILRSQLVRALHEAVTERLGAQALMFGLTYSYLERPGEIPNGAGRPEEVTLPADLVIGADGLHSKVRRLTVPDGGDILWNGISMWRGTAESRQLLDGRTMFIIGHSNCRIVVYPVESLPENRNIINWVLEVRTSDPCTVNDPSTWGWADPDCVPMEYIRQFPASPVDFASLVATTSKVLQTPMVDKDPEVEWSSTFSTLVGDAAHPMYPVGSNGASQAILDALQLSQSLLEAESISDALQSYESQRKPRTTDLVYANRKGGPEHCLNLSEFRFRELGEELSTSELQLHRKTAEAYRRIASFDRATVNADPERGGSAQ
jgi:2-polyprenyl-6-methoxyphenol hydroxylase-like FAD-dependent oxidoreductase